MRTILAGVLGLMFLAGSAMAYDRWGDHGRTIVDFEVVRTRLITRECAGCGDRRGDYIGLGVFRVETRLYSEFVRGRVVRTWRETEEFFDHCVGRREHRRWD
jgi:hypothetical protein